MRLACRCRRGSKPEHAARRAKKSLDARPQPTIGAHGPKGDQVRGLVKFRPRQQLFEPPVLDLDVGQPELTDNLSKKSGLAHLHFDQDHAETWQANLYGN